MIVLLYGYPNITLSGKEKVFIVIFVVTLAAGVKSKPSSRERLFLRTANPKRAAAHSRPGPEL